MINIEVKNLEAVALYYRGAIDTGMLQYKPSERFDRQVGPAIPAAMKKFRANQATHGPEAELFSASNKYAAICEIAKIREFSKNPDHTFEILEKIINGSMMAGFVDSIYFAVKVEGLLLALPKLEPTTENFEIALLQQEYNNVLTNFLGLQKESWEECASHACQTLDYFYAIAGMMLTNHAFPGTYVFSQTPTFKNLKSAVEGSGIEAYSVGLLKTALEIQQSNGARGSENR